MFQLDFEVPHSELSVSEKIYISCEPCVKLGKQKKIKSFSILVFIFPQTKRSNNIIYV